MIYSTKNHISIFYNNTHTTTDKPAKEVGENKKPALACGCFNNIYFKEIKK